MSVNTNQFLIYGVKLSPLDCQAILETIGEDEISKYQDDNSFKSEVPHYNGLFWITDSMNGKFDFVGLVLEKGLLDYGDPVGDGGVLIDSLTDYEKQTVMLNLETHLGIHGRKLEYYLVNRYS